MNTEIDKMTPAELDAAIAREVMCWTLDQDSDVWISGADAMEAAGDYHPSSNISDAFAAEKEVERRGLIARYTMELWQKAFQSGPDYKTHWELVHASPADRCRAMVRTVRRHVGSAKEGNP